MLSKCANPGCGTPFRYLGEGKVFVAEWANRGDVCELGHSSSLQRWGHRELFWLCNRCYRSMTLMMKENEVVAAPRGQKLTDHDRLLREIRMAS